MSAFIAPPTRVPLFLKAGIPGRGGAAVAGEGIENPMGTVFALDGHHEQAYPDRPQGKCQPPDNPCSMYFSGEPGPQRCAQQNTYGQQHGAADALRKGTGCDMGQRSRKRHVGQDKLRGRSSDVHRKIQQVYQHGHVDDSPADAQHAGEKADRHAHEDPQGPMIREMMDRAVGLGHGACPVIGRAGPRRFFPASGLDSQKD